MKNKLVLIILIFTIFLQYCKNPDKEKEVILSDQIVTETINKNIILIQDVYTLTNSTDSISQHVDSILSGLINFPFISTGQKSFDLNKDQVQDLAFEIIDLNLFNANHLPATLDSMAARAIPFTMQFLDNSTHSYPDALTENSVISSTGNWTQNTCVLGTFLNAGQFQGKGERYLGFRFVNSGYFNYGWIKIYCSQHNDTLNIIEFAYNNTNDKEIRAGQKQ